MKILGIETSCDETAASIVNDEREILSHILYSQVKEHLKYGGVVPEIASRSHLLNIQKIVSNALEIANTNLNEIDGIAVTTGPGLIGGLLVGLMFAKGLCYPLSKPLITVNHLEAHVLTARLTNPELSFPYLILLVSGGHCQILQINNVGEYIKFGSTLDDALGEAFDKVAKMLGLGYPGGPIVEKLALDGDENYYKLPQAMKGRNNCDFSFSGLKTAVRLIIEKETLTAKTIANICASFQKTVSEILIDRLKNAIKISNSNNNLVIAGGVAANQYIFKKVSEAMEYYGLRTIAPPINLCTDNGAMVAWAGVEKLKLGMIDSLNSQPKARWPLGC